MNNMYRKFSDFYDELVFDIDYKKYSQNIIDILNDNNIQSGNLLEIACGTGNLTQRLAVNKNFKITAFDYSDQMLNHAYNKLIDHDNVDLLHFDMYSFPYDNFEFDAIITLLDVINYILDDKKLKDLFTKVYDGLKDGGVFIFDINSKYKLLEVLADNTFVYERNDIFYTWENQLDGEEVNFDLNFFIKNDDGSYSRFEENQVEKYHSIEKIEGILQEIGFKNISYKDEDGGPYKKDKTQRVLFRAIK